MSIFNTKNKRVSVVIPAHNESASILAVIKGIQENVPGSEIIVVDARPEGDAMMLTIRTDVWPEPREFALLKSGSLAW